MKKANIYWIKGSNLWAATAITPKVGIIFCIEFVFNRFLTKIASKPFLTFGRTLKELTIAVLYLAFWASCK